MQSYTYKLIFNKNSFFDNFQQQAELSFYSSAEAPEQRAKLVKNQ